MSPKSVRRQFCTFFLSINFLHGLLIKINALSHFKRQKSNLSIAKSVIQSKKALHLPIRTTDIKRQSAPQERSAMYIKIKS